jgi:hypothetical protein
MHSRPLSELSPMARAYLVKETPERIAGRNLAERMAFLGGVIAEAGTQRQDITKTWHVLPKDFRDAVREDFGLHLLDGYFAQTAFERSGALFSAVGGAAFSRYYPMFGSAWGTSAMGHRTSDLKTYVAVAKGAELAHDAVWLWLLGGAVSHARKGQLRLAAAQAVSSTAVAWLPNITLRHQRHRVEHVLERREEKLERKRIASDRYR